MKPHYFNITTIQYISILLLYPFPVNYVQQQGISVRDITEPNTFKEYELYVECKYL